MPSNNKIKNILMSLLVAAIFMSLHCSDPDFIDALTMEIPVNEIDPPPRGTSFVLNSPENEQLFSLSENELSFSFGYTRDSTDFSDYNFMIQLCRDQALTTDCIDPVSVTMSDEDESGVSLPVLSVRDERGYQFVHSLLLTGLFILFALGILFLFAPPSSLFERANLYWPFGTPLSLILAFWLTLSCISTEPPTVEKEASPVLVGEMSISVSDLELTQGGAYYWRVAAIPDDDASETETSETMEFFWGLESTSLELTTVILVPGDTAGEPILVEGATSYSLSECADFAIDSSSGQVTVATVPTSGPSQECTIRASNGTNSIDLTLTINYPTLVFNRTSYDFTITFALASANDRVGVIPVTATVIIGAETISYSFDPPCPDFAIDNASGQITAVTASPPSGIRNCSVSATAGGETITTPVTISGCDLGEPATFNSEISDCDFDGFNNTADLDSDQNNLIDVYVIEQLNAVRFDLDGNGTPAGTTTEIALYRTAYGIMNDGQGCTSCNGFELTRSLDFNDAGSYRSGTVDTAYTEGAGRAGWLPIGDDTNSFSATFDGGRFRISNLFINRPTMDHVGLFGLLAGTIRSLGLANVKIIGNEFVGGLSGEIGSLRSIMNCYVTGSLGTDDVGSSSLGGLAGENRGNITSSYAEVNLTDARQNVGGLVGDNEGIINNSYAAGTIMTNGPEAAGQDIGGLIGLSNVGSVTNSYSLSNLNSAYAQLGGLIGSIGSSLTVRDSYTVGMIPARPSRGDLFGKVAATAAIAGVNYFAGFGSSTAGCSAINAPNCVQAVGANPTARKTWLRDTLDETRAFTTSWSSNVWGDLGRTGVFPCLLNMPEGAPQCPAPAGTVHPLP